MYTQNVFDWLGRKMPDSDNESPSVCPVAKRMYLSELLDISPDDVLRWGRIVPPGEAFVLSLISDGALALKAECYPRLENMMRHHWKKMPDKARRKHEMSFKVLADIHPVSEKEGPSVVIDLDYHARMPRPKQVKDKFSI